MGIAPKALKALTDLSQSGPGDVGDIAKMFSSEVGKVTKDFLKVGKDSLGDFKKALSGGNLNDIKTSITSFERTLEGAIKLITTSVQSFATSFFNTLTVANKTWLTMYTGGIEGSMKVLKDQAIKLTMGDSAGGRALSGFMDNLIQSMMFRFEEGLKWRETRQAAAVQMGTGAGGGFASGVTKWNWALGRSGAAEAGAAMAGAGFTSVEVFDKMLGASKQMGMNISQAAESLKAYSATGLDAMDAVNAMETNFRKLQAAAKGTTLPVKDMANYVQQAATAARFMNVDIGLVGTAMSGLVKQSKELSGFGLDMRIHGQGILKDFATGGSKMTESMYAFYGSKGGTETRGVGMDWMAGRFGEKAAMNLQRTIGGGFTMGGADVISGNAAMEQRLRVQLRMMQEAAEGSADQQEAFLRMIKMGKETLGLSEEASIALATGGEEGLSKILNNGELAAQFKSSTQIMGELQSGDARREQLQRELVALNIKQLDMALLLPSALEGLGEYIRTGKSTMLGMVAEQGTETLQDMFKEGSNIAKLFKGTDPETFEKMKEFANRMTALIPPTMPGLQGKADGGSVTAGSAYVVGERGPEMFMPGSSGTIVPNGSAGGVTINLNVSGVTKDGIINEVINKLNNLF